MKNITVKLKCQEISYCNGVHTMALFMDGRLIDIFTVVESEKEIK